MVEAGLHELVSDARASGRGRSRPRGMPSCRARRAGRRSARSRSPSAARRAGARSRRSSHRVPSAPRRSPRDGDLELALDDEVEAVAGIPLRDQRRARREPRPARARGRGPRAQEHRAARRSAARAGAPSRRPAAPLRQRPARSGGRSRRRAAAPTARQTNAPRPPASATKPDAAIEPTASPAIDTPSSSPKTRASASGRAMR